MIETINIGFLIFIVLFIILFIIDTILEEEEYTFFSLSILAGILISYMMVIVVYKDQEPKIEYVDKIEFVEVIEYKDRIIEKHIAIDGSDIDLILDDIVELVDIYIEYNELTQIHNILTFEEYFKLKNE